MREGEQPRSRSEIGRYSIKRFRREENVVFTFVDSPAVLERF